MRRLTGKPDSPLFSRPYGVAWDGEDLLTTDPAAGRVLRIPTRGKKLRTSSPQLFAGPIGIAVCPPGIVVTDSRTGDVALLDRDLQLVRWLARGLERPSGVACRGDKTYVAETGRHRLLVIGPEDAVTTIGSRGNELGQFNFPAALAIDGDTLWVGDTLNFRLQKISLSSGQALTAFGQLGDAPGEMPRIKGVAVDRDGNLWIADAHLDQVSLYAQDGEFLMGIGETGAEPGQLSFPAGVAAHRDGKIAVVGERLVKAAWIVTEKYILARRISPILGWVVGVLAILLLAQPVLAQQESVVSTVHNLSISGPGEIRSLTEEQVCKFCHVPHNATVPAPLWGHAVTRAQYQVPTIRAGSTRQPTPQPDGSSRLCLSCHDGTIALGDVAGEPVPIPMTGAVRLTSGHKGFIGTDLSGSHPISFRLSDAEQAAPDESDMSLRAVGAIRADPEVRLDAAGKMQCTTCHDPHSDRFYVEGQVPRFWVKPTVDDVCLTCHALR
jgi:hypothetical protein